MTLQVKQTIFALASAAGKAGVSVFRISGPSATNSISMLTQLNPKEMIPNSLTLTTIYSNCTKNSLSVALDKAMIVHFAAPRSFTGEDVVEIHCHGSIAICKALIHALGKLPDFRLAEPGEFAKRAFLNGKLSLIQAEGLGALIEASTETQRKQAFKHLSGQVSCQIKFWASKLLQATAQIEAFIDFGESEEDNQVLQFPKALSRAFELVREIHGEIGKVLQASSQRIHIQEGFKVCVVGDANVGKSSLINAIAQSKVSIVSSQAGTTRDIVKTWIELGGWKIEIADTAGIRGDDSMDECCEVEREGIELSREQASKADFVIQMIDVMNPKFVAGVEADLVVFNKCDQIIKENDAINKLERLKAQNPEALFISCLEEVKGGGIGGGVDQVCSKIIQRASEVFLEQDEEAVWVANARQQEILKDAFDCCEKFIACEGMTAIDNIAVPGEYLRMANDALGRIMGRIDVEVVLDEIFSKFCIGK